MEYRSFPMQKEKGLQLRDCGHEVCEQAHSFGPAVRDYYLLHVIRKGRGLFENKFGRYEAQAGQGFMIFPGEITVYTADMQDPWEYDWVGFAGEVAGEWVQKLSITQLCPVIAMGEYAGRVTRVMRDVYEDSAALDERELAAVGGLYRLFAWLWQIAQPQSGRWTVSQGERYYQRAYWYMEGNFQRDLQIADVAAYVGLSRSQLFRIFVKHGGISPQQALLSMRLAQAQTLLRTTELPLKAVALSSGFSSAARMGDVFRQEKGMTPTQFREKG